MIVDDILREAGWVKDWRDKKVEHTTPSGQKRRVKIKSLPPEEQLQYKPDHFIKLLHKEVKKYY